MRTTLFVAVCGVVWSFAITALPVSAQSVGAITSMPAYSRCFLLPDVERLNNPNIPKT